MKICNFLDALLNVKIVNQMDFVQLQEFVLASRIMRKIPQEFADRFVQKLA